jgi:UDPglucose 6-dehydrogenase
MKIGIIGSGYVGLVTGVCLATKGFSVICFDSNQRLLEKLNSGTPPFYEPELENFLGDALSANKIIGTDNFQSMMEQIDVIFIAVGTPSDNGKIDLSQIASAATMIGEYIKISKRYISVLVKSTVVPGTTLNFVNTILTRVSGKKVGEFGLGMNPEFLREGSAINDFMHPDRVVIGYEDIRTKEICDLIYSNWQCKKIYCNTATAEMIKYTNNVLLASLISLNNELANLASLIGGIDYSDVIEGVISDGRWSFKNHDGNLIHPSVVEYFKPGIGFGGSCFPKDVEAIRTHGNNYNLPMKILNAVLDVNSEQIDFTIDFLNNRIENLIEKNILVLGLAFKPDTDDLRQSSSVRIINKLQHKVKSIAVHDPVALNNFFDNNVTDNQNYIRVKNWEVEILMYDVIIIGTNWNEYLNLISITDSGILKNKFIFDSKSFFKKELKNCNYLKIGK